MIASYTITAPPAGSAACDTGEQRPLLGEIPIMQDVPEDDDIGVGQRVGEEVAAGERGARAQTLALE